MKVVSLALCAVLSASLLAPWNCVAAPTLDFDKAATEAKSVAATVPTDSASMFSKEALDKDSEHYAKHIMWQRDFVERSWDWHLWSTRLLFVIVLAIVSFGLWITYRQFQRDYGVRGNTPTDEATPTPVTAAEHQSQPASSLKISPAGLEITSQVIGLLVLGFSLAFFYFYVKDVYPIQEYQLGKPTSKGVDPKAAGGETTPIPAPAAKQ